MKYILDNPTFTNKPIEIDNYEAVQQISDYIDKSIMLKDIILLVVCNTNIWLQLISIDKDEYRFKNIK